MVNISCVTYLPLEKVVVNSYISPRVASEWDDGEVDVESRVVHYQRAKLLLGCAWGALGIAAWPALVCSGLSTCFAEVASSVCASSLPSFLLFACLVACAQVAVLSPLAVANDVLVERHYGLSRQSWRSWFLEQAKAMAVGAGVGVPILVLFYYLWKALPAWWWIPFAAAMVGVEVALAVVGPRLVLPLFYRLEPVHNSELVARLARLARPLGLNVEAVVRFDLSSKSRKANAALVGVGPTRRILLSDTLLQNFAPEEVECVVAHEIGHHYHRHTRKLLAAGAVQTSLGLALTALLYPWACAVCEVRPETFASLPLMPSLFALWNVLTSPVMNALSRHFEMQADRFVLERHGAAQAFASALRRLGAMNMADPTPHRLVEFFFCSHPSLGRRVRVAECYGAQC